MSDYLYRINGFDQIKSFYSWLFNNQDKNINTSHVSLYLFLINQNNRSNWVEWFKLPYDLGMAGSCIGSRNTYYKCLKDLQEWKLIEYQKGTNNYKAPIIKLCLFKNEHLIEQVPVPQSEPLTEHLPIPLTEPLTEHIYKLLTDNLKLITDNLTEILEFLSESKPIIDYDSILENFHLYCDRMAKVSKLSDQRKKHIQARFKEFNFDTIINVIKKAGKSDFLCGINEKAWKADFDWIFNPSNFLKIMEGKYDNKDIKVNGFEKLDKNGKPRPSQQYTLVSGEWTVL